MAGNESLGVVPHFSNADAVSILETTYPAADIGMVVAGVTAGLLILALVEMILRAGGRRAETEDGPGEKDRQSDARVCYGA